MQQDKDKGFMKRYGILILFLFITFSHSECIAATYYVDGSMKSDNGYGTEKHPKKYIKSGIALLSGGDTLIIKNGVYVGIENMMCNNSGWAWEGIPNGAPGKYTVIKAENYLGAIIDGKDEWNPIYITNRSYVRLENLHVRNCGSKNEGSNFNFQHCDHIKVIRCASEEAYYWHFRYSNCRYTLTEDCFAWGRSAYSFVFKGEWENYPASQYNVVRRCVARRGAHYYAPEGNQWASFVSYYGDNNYFQNCISIDGNYIYAGTINPPPPFERNAFYIANGGSNYAAEGCLTINDDGGVATFESGGSPVIFRNNVCILSSQGGKRGIHHRDGSGGDGNSVAVENCVIANGRGTDYWDGGIGEGGEAKLLSGKNNIIYDNQYGLINVEGNHGYNVLYRNKDGDFKDTKRGDGEVTDKNPVENGLRYPVRIEEGSYLSKAGENNTRCGPEILKRIGVSETLYGEEGWNILTGEDLWPFPNEDAMRERMKAYNRHGANGARGFCGDGMTLTKYIWEYLGNSIPPEIYGGKEIR